MRCFRLKYYQELCQIEKGKGIRMERNKLNKFFSRKTIEGLLKSTPSNELLEEVKYSNILYEQMSNNYRNEYYYKNMIFNKLVMGKYSLSTTFAMSEVPVNKSKADFIVINSKKDFVIEIKTELDTLDKLIYQIEDYYKISSLVYVLVSESNFYPVFRMLRETNVGILVLTKKNTISLKREAVNDYSKLSHESLFKLLRKNEYENIIKREFREIPKVMVVEKFQVCFQFFKTIEIKKSKNLVFEQLNRRRNEIDIEYINQVPQELRWMVYLSRLNREKYERLLNNL